MGHVGWLIAVVVAVAAVVLLVGWFVASRRHRTPVDEAPTPPMPPPVTHHPDPAPMTDLESALSSVMDRSGRPIREKIDAEASHVDELRDPDDTGPLLRRALDSVEHHDEHHDEQRRDADGV